MTLHLQREIENLKKDILTVGAMVEQRIREASGAIEFRDETLAKSVIEKDINLDEIKIEVEENCLKILALYRPIASDLRFIMTVLKISHDLGYVGDLTVNIAEHALVLVAQLKVNLELNYMTMAVRTQDMLNKSLNAFVDYNMQLAEKNSVCCNEIVNMNRQIYLIVQEAINNHPDQLEPLMHVLSASRQLEQIANHAVNIAENVIYMITGEICRRKT